MANNYGVANTTFKPFSFEEMLKPALMATETQEKLENEYTNLSAIVSVIEDKLTKNPKDKNLRDTYNSYKEELNKASNLLYNQGLTPDSRKALNRLKVDYGSKIDPINKAITKYQEQQDIINKMAITHPEIIIVGAGDSISDYMNGNNPELTSVNLDKLMTQAMTGAKADAVRTHRVSKWKPTAGGKFLEQTTEVGLTNEEFEKAMTNIAQHKQDNSVKLSENAKSILNLITDISGNSNYGLLKGKDQQRAYEAILTGLRLGYAYDKKIQTQSNPGYAYAKAKAEQEAKLKNTILADRNVGNSLFITSDSAKQKMLTFFNADGSLKKEYTKYFDSKGNLKSEEEIQKLVNDIATSNTHWNSLADPLSTNPSLTRRMDNNYKELKEAMSSLGLKDNQFTLSNIDLMLTADATNTDPNKSQDVAKTNDAIARFRGSVRVRESDRDNAQTVFEEGLGTSKTASRIIGLDSNGNYKTEPISYDKLLKDGKLNISHFEIDYSTGDIIAKIKTPKNGIQEFVLPASSLYNDSDYFILSSMAKDLNLASKKNPLDAIDSNLGAPSILSNYGELRKYYTGQMDDILLELLNVHGIANVNK